MSATAQAHSARPFGHFASRSARHLAHFAAYSAHPFDTASPQYGRLRHRRVPTFALICAAVILGGCEHSDSADGSQKVNGSVHIAAGKAPAPADTVNGAIDIDDNATVTGANTVNGSVRLGAHSTAELVNTVNGAITLGAGARVQKAAETVNGTLTLQDGAEVLGPLANVNGKIELSGAHVGGGIKTVNGSMNILGNSHVEGGILVGKTGFSLIHFGNEVPRIVIGPGATVQGNLRFERPVQLYVSDRATIGPVTGATPIPFSGDTPPAG
jgi:hypothetical protein